MSRLLVALLINLLCYSNLSAEIVRLETSNNDYQLTNFFSDVDLFTIEVNIDMTAAPGLYFDPPIISVNYRVFGTLEPGTPSEFPSFDLQRNISGTEFYEQGGSLLFEIAADADFTDEFKRMS